MLRTAADDAPADTTQHFTASGCLLLTPVTLLLHQYCCCCTVLLLLFPDCTPASTPDLS
jgi:hypothetical protein